MYNNDSNSLNAGAPDIRLTGNQDPNTQMASANDPMADANDMSLQLFGKPIHELTPPELELFQEEMERLKNKVRAPQQNSGIMAAAPTYTQRRRAQMAGGGIMGSNNGSMLVAPTADGSRPGYADWWNPMTWVEPIKEVAKKVGQTIIPGGETGYFDLYGTGDQQYDSEGRPKVNWKGPLAIGAAAGAAQKLIPQAPLPTDTSGIDMASAIRGDNLRFRPRDEVLAASGGRIGYDNGGVTADASGVMSQVSPSRKTQIQGNEMADQAYNEIFQKFYEKFPGLATGEETMAEMIAMLQAEGVMETENLGILGLDRSMDMITPESAERSARRISMGDTQYGDIPAMAHGGRIGAAEGGLMNLGGMEKDYRAEGGFVPIGGQERADDVPARLSKNEFVFTADAVRSAGGGDIDAGAEVMENVMNNLEQGGQISQESQGLEGARNMFATAQRLGEVI